MEQDIKAATVDHGHVRRGSSNFMYILYTIYNRDGHTRTRD